jgi:hypothetical protein
VVVFRPCEGIEENALEDFAVGDRAMTAVSRTTFRHATTGRVLPYRNGTVRAQQALISLDRRYPGQLSALDLARLYQFVHAQDRDGFFQLYLGKGERAAEWCKGEGARLFQSRLQECQQFRQIWMQNVAAGLWTDLHSIRLTGEFAWTPFNLTLRRTAAEVPTPDQTVLVNAADNEGSVVVPQGRDLSGVRGIRMALVSGTTRVAASNVAVDATGTMLTGRFAALGRFGLTAKDLQLVVTFPRQIEGCPKGPEPCTLTYPAKLHSGASPASPSPYTLDATSTGILADAAGRGRLNIIVARTPPEGEQSKTLALTISGGEIARVETVRGLTVTGDDRGWKVSPPGEATLLLENLIPNSLVTVTLRDGDRQVAIISRPVIARGREGKD